MCGQLALCVNDIRKKQIRLNPAGEQSCSVSVIDLIQMIKTEHENDYAGGITTQHNTTRDLFSSLNVKNLAAGEHTLKNNNVLS